MSPRAPRKEAASSATGTAKRILDVAEQLVQTNGFNGFSYADVAAKLRITKASLHYHFPSKAELGRSLIVRYHQRFFEALAEIQYSFDDAPEQLRRYVELYAGVLRQNRMCLCGMLASEHATLPKPMKEAVTEFFGANERWLSQLLDGGRTARSLWFSGPADEVARLLVSTLEGAMMVARSFGDVGRFEKAAARLLDDLQPAPSRTR